MQQVFFCKLCTGLLAFLLGILISLDFYIKNILI